MKKLLGLTLGIMTALGGFVDMGQLVFTMQAGALFGYRLLWMIALGTVTIIIFSEMAGRIAAVKKKAVFTVIKEELGPRLGMVALISSNAVNLITCAAEISGVALLLRLLTGHSYRLGLVVAALLLTAIVWFLRFKWIERVFGLAGLFLLVYLFSAWKIREPWAQMLPGFLPSIPSAAAGHRLLYAYFAVGLFSAVIMPYEVFFYSSGAIEEKWTVANLSSNKIIATFGSSLGALLTIALLVLGKLIFQSHGIFPDLLSSTIFPAAAPYGKKVFYAASAGALAAISGAAVETALSNGYATSQFFGWKWGRAIADSRAPRFAMLWAGTMAAALLIALTGVDPLLLVDASIVFAMVILPLTYLPVLLLASRSSVMGKHANGRFTNYLAWILFALITVAAVAALPLMVLTRGGQP